MNIQGHQLELLRLFEKYRTMAQESRWRRVLQNPRRMTYSKLLEITLNLFGGTLSIEGKTFWGEFMCLFAPEASSMTIHRYGFFDEGMTQILLEHLRPGMTFFDIGAHYGYFTVLAAHIVGESGKVHAFEPTPSTFTILKKNVAEKKNVVLNNLAVNSDSGSFFINAHEVRFSAFNSLFNPRIPKSKVAKIKSSKILVEAVALDRYTALGGVPDFIKIDAEGSEQKILHGMEHIINKHHPIIAMEVGDWEIDGTVSCCEVVNSLLERGYRAYEYRNGKIARHEMKGRYEDGNLLFLPG